MTDAPEKMPDEIMAWRSRPGLDHAGTWATTRYPPEAQGYTRTDLHLALVASAKREARNEALREAAELAFEADDCYLARNAILALMEETDDD